MADFKEDMRALYMKTGVKGNPIVFLFTDQQIFDERMLIFLNDILSSGYIPDLFTDDDKDNIINAVRNEAKAAPADGLARQLLELLHRPRARAPAPAHLHVARRRQDAQPLPQVPGAHLVHGHQLVLQLAARGAHLGRERFLGDVEMASDELRENVRHHMAFVHESVEQGAVDYLAAERREVYTTPKSYLELIILYKDELLANRTRARDAQDAPRGGPRQAARRAGAGRRHADPAQGGGDRRRAEEGRDGRAARRSSGRSRPSPTSRRPRRDRGGEGRRHRQGVSAFQEQANRRPRRRRARDREGGGGAQQPRQGALTELKGDDVAAAGVLNVVNAVQYMLAPKGANLKKVDRVGGAKKMMGDGRQVPRDAAELRQGQLPAREQGQGAQVHRPAGGGPSSRLQLQNPEFNFASCRSRRAGLCDWVVNMLIYHDIYLDVAPKRAHAPRGGGKLADANKKLAAVNANVAALDARKQSCRTSSRRRPTRRTSSSPRPRQTAKRLNLAERLVNGLKDEGVRWAQNVENLDAERELLVGDVMVSSPFIAYIAPFNAVFRTQLWERTWTPDLRGRGIPCSDELDPLPAHRRGRRPANWRAEGLPSDRLSTQNAAIITRCARFPLDHRPAAAGHQLDPQARDAQRPALVPAVLRRLPRQGDARWRRACRCCSRR